MKKTIPIRIRNILGLAITSLGLWLVEGGLEIMTYEMKMAFVTELVKAFKPPKEAK